VKEKLLKRTSLPKKMQLYNTRMRILPKMNWWV